MTYNETISYIAQETQPGSHPGLERITELLEHLGNPQERLHFLHIAGTNGKGSTAAMLSSILTEAGYRTGLFTSPHLYHMTESLKIDGTDISDDVFSAIALQVGKAMKSMKHRPSEFEFLTAAAFLWFASQRCDLVILECGMGGRLDSTNVISSKEAAILTTIGLDHTGFLGNTLEEIAAEKAGIILESTDVILSMQEFNTTMEIMDICRKRHARLFSAGIEDLEFKDQSLEGQRLLWKQRIPLSLPLLGAHQIINLSTVLKTVEVLNSKGWEIFDKDVQEGLKSTRWPGRFEVIHKNPMVILDGGHNPQCVQTIADTLTQLFPKKKIHFLAGILADKEVSEMIAITAPLAASYVTVTPPNPRAMEAEALAALIEKQQPEIPVYYSSTISEGVQRVLAQAGPDDVICAFGSLYMSNALRDAFLSHF